MGFIEILLIGAGLSMDAFAVAVCKGLNMKRINYQHAAVIALFFGGFQALMPFAGWLLGKSFEKYITSIDHWIAFILLGIIGGKMVLDALRSNDGEACPTCEEERLNLQELFVMAIATSIDALAVGITFAFLRVNILSAVSVIGITTFLLSLLGVILGNKFGARYEKKAELAGGVILILIGTKILIEHLQG